MPPKTKVKSEWKNLKRIVVRRFAVKNLKLLDAKKLKAICNEKGKSLLHVAAKSAFSEVSEYLIGIGLSVNFKDSKNGYTPLMNALRRDDEEGKKISKLFLKSGLDVSWKSIEGSQFELLSKDEKVASKLCRALRSHARGSQASAERLLSEGWSLDSIASLRNERILLYALNHSSYFSCLELFEAVSGEDVLRVKLLLEPVAHSRRITSWALLKAARTRSPASPMIVKLLLEKGALINGYPGDDRTPLEEALVYHNVDNCWVLLDQGASFTNLKIFDVLCHSAMKSNNAYKCISLLFEYLGLWSPGLADRYFTNILWLRNYYWVIYLILRYLSIECHGTGLKGKNIIPSSYKYCREDYDACSRELRKMGSYRVDDKVTALDVVIETTDGMVRFTRNEKLMSSVTSADFAKCFPQHSKILQFKIGKALEKRLMIDQSVGVLKKCLPLVGSYEPVLEKIVYFLGVPNLLCLE